MTYQGKRARPMASGNGRFFEVSKIRLGTDGHVVSVLWVEVDARSERDVGAPVLATVAEVVDAIHEGAQVAAVFLSLESHLTEHRPEHRPERAFVVVEREDGKEYIAFNDEPSHGRNLCDVASLDS